MPGWMWCVSIFLMAQGKSISNSAELTRSLARAAGHAVGVLADLQGPKIRIGRFEKGNILLKDR